MSLTERANQVLRELDAELAKWDAATPGPWVRRDYNIKQPIGRQIADVGPHHTPPDEYPESCKREDERNGDAIASSRTVCPAALRMAKKSIERLLQFSTGDTCAEHILAELCDEWEANRK